MTRKHPSREEPTEPQVDLQENSKEDAAMYELDQPSNEELELERLFADDLGVEKLPTPPEGLADRIKAEIPVDLGWQASSADESTDMAPPGAEASSQRSVEPSSGRPGVVVPLWRHRGVLALAATLMLAVGLWTIVPRPEEGTREDNLRGLTDARKSPAAETPSAVRGDEGLSMEGMEGLSTEDLSTAADSAVGSSRSGTQGDTAPASGEQERELRQEMSRSLERLRRQTSPTTGDSHAGDGAGSRAGNRAAHEGGRAPRSAKVPVPDPTPDEPESIPDVEFDLPVERVMSIPPASAPPAPPAPPRPRTAKRPVPPPGYPSSPPPAPRQRADAENRKLEEIVVVSEAKPTGLLRPSASLQPPNDGAYDAMYFDSAGVNPFVDTEDDALSTFGLDVDTASYTVVRRYLQDGNLPPHEAVRVEEMLNFFDYGDAPPASTDEEAAEPENGEFALHADVAPSPWAPGDNRSERYYLMRFGLKARDVLATERPPALLTFVVDVSGSMAREDRLGLVKRALGLLLDNLQDGDEVALVVYGTQGRVLLEPTASHDAVRAAIDRLHSEGSTNAAEGLRLAYELTARHRKPGRIHRVILCSDGVANVGSTTSGEGILSEVKRWGKQGVELTTVGFGMGNYNDTLMETLADQGNGRYAYVDTLDEARRIFIDDLTGTLTTVAAETRAQVAFDEDVVSRYRLLGYENRDIADERFRDDTVDAGEIGAGHAVTALYEVKTKRPLKTRDRLATITLRYASIARGEMVEQARAVTGRDAAPSFDEASRALRLAATVAEFAEVLRGSYWARDVDLGEVFAEAQRVSAEWPGDADIAEFASLVGKAERLRQRE